MRRVPISKRTLPDAQPEPLNASLETVSFRYAAANTPAIKSIDIQVPAGQFVLLTGPSGGGKSTVLRLCNGLIPHYNDGELTGQVRLETSKTSLDPQVAPLWETGGQVATVFQNPRTQFYTTDSTSEIAFALENRGIEPAVIRQRISTTAAEMEIEGLLGRSMFSFSGGELQLIACASARVATPRLYLFDEPTSNLSEEAIESFSKVLADLKATGNTVLIAEHRLYFLEGLIDRALIIDGDVRADMSGTDFFAMNNDTRTSFGLRQLQRPQIELSAEQVPLGSNAIPVPTVTVPRAQCPETDSPSGLALEAVRAKYGRRVVWDIANLFFSRGQVTAVTGSNGIGKSTLAAVITGLKKAKGGTISLDGKVLSEKQRVHCSYLVMQDVHRQLFADSVRAEITLGLERSGAAPLNDEAVDTLLKRFNLLQYADRHPLSLSGGQKQRLVIASAVASQREVYVFDEPSSGLDRRHLEGVAAALRELARENKVVILITHDPELINACADRHLQLTNGH